MNWESPRRHLSPTSSRAASRPPGRGGAAGAAANRSPVRAGPRPPLPHTHPPPSRGSLRNRQRGRAAIPPLAGTRAGSLGDEALPGNPRRRDRRPRSSGRSARPPAPAPREPGLPDGLRPRARVPASAGSPRVSRAVPATPPSCRALPPAEGSPQATTCLRPGWETPRDVCVGAAAPSAAAEPACQHPPPTPGRRRLFLPPAGRSPPCRPPLSTTSRRPSLAWTIREQSLPPPEWHSSRRRGHIPPLPGAGFPLP